MTSGYVNWLLNEGEPNDDQSNGQGQAPASSGVLLAIGLFFMACAIWALAHGLGEDGNERSWIAFGLALAAATLSFLAAARKRRTGKG